MKFLTTLFLFLSAFALNAQEQETIFNLVEVQPLFGNCQGMDKNAASECSNKAVIEFLSRNLSYPPIARESGIQGTVVVQFTVAKDGSTSDHKILRDIGGGCGKEALRVVEMMRTWKPGQQNGQVVAARMTLPIRFQLESDLPSGPQFTLYTGKYSSDHINKADLEKALNTAPIARDADGNAIKIQSLTLTVETRRKTKTVSVTTDVPNKAMKHLAKKAKKGGSAMLEAKLQQSGKSYTAQRIWTIL